MEVYVVRYARENITLREGEGLCSFYIQYAMHNTKAMSMKFAHMSSCIV